MTRKAAILIVPLVCLLALWLYTEKRDADAVRPSGGGTNLAGFLAARPQPVKIRKFMHSGKVHFEVVGKRPSSALSLPSGPPAYIFDETGTLVDWTADLGDSPSFVSKWGSGSNATFITAAEAKQLVATRTNYDERK